MTAPTDIAYAKTNWKDQPSTDTPLDAVNLNNLEAGVAAAVRQANTGVSGNVSTAARAKLGNPKLSGYHGKDTWDLLMFQDFDVPMAEGSWTDPLNAPEPYNQQMRGFRSGNPDTNNVAVYDTRVVSVHGGCLDIAFRTQAWNYTNLPYVHSSAVNGQVKPTGAAITPSLYPPGSSQLVRAGQVSGRYAMKFRVEIDGGGDGTGYGMVGLLWSAADNWPDGEIDFPEGSFKSGKPLQANFHKLGTPSLFSSTNGPIALANTGDHIYEVEWKPGYVAAYLDGVLVKEMTDAAYIPVLPMVWRIQLGNATGAPVPDPALSGHVLIDWWAAWAPSARVQDVATQVAKPRSTYQSTSDATLTLSPGVTDLVDATSGNKIRKIAAGVTVDDEITVKLVALTKPNSVTIMGDTGVTSSTVPLTAVNQGVTLVWTGSAWVLKGRDNPKAFLDETYAPNISLVQAQKTVIKGDQTAIYTSSTAPAFDNVPLVDSAAIKVDPFDVGQSILGFGAALTDSSAYLLMKYCTLAQRTALFTRLFSPSQGNLSMLRICLGDSDFRVDANYYTYDDTSDNSPDTSFNNFSISRDLRYIVPLMLEIQAINPNIRFVGSMWSPPAWMKTLQSGATALDIAQGGFNSTYYAQLAQYYVLILQAFQAFGINFYALTGFNEPSAVYAGRPSMIFGNSQAVAFYGPFLKTAMVAAGFAGVKLWPNDSSWDPSISDNIIPSYLASTVIMQAVDGFSYHGYSGDPETGQGLARRSGKSVHLSEIRTLLSQSWTSSIRQMTGVMLIDAMRAGAESFCFWNLALDPSGQPTQGSTGRRGVVTINTDGTGVAMAADGVTFSNAPDLYSLLAFAPFIRPGAKRIGSTYNANGLKTVAVMNPDGEAVLVVYNAGSTAITTQVGDSRTSQTFVDTFGVGDVVIYRYGTTKTVLPSGTPTTVSAPDAPTIAATASKLTMNLMITPGTGVGTTGLRRYNLYCSIDGATPTYLTAILANGTSSVPFADRRAEVVTAHTYSYSVEAVGAKASVRSNSTPATAPLAGTVPSKPTNVAATAGSSAATVVWNAPADDGGSTITGYTVTRTDTAAGTTTSFAVGRTLRSYTDGTAVASKAYTYTVSATNATGTSANSDSSNSVTPFASATTSVLTPFFSTDKASYTVSVTPVTGDNYMIVFISYPTFDKNGGSVASVAWGSTNLELLDSYRPGTAQQGGDRCIDTWQLYVPAGLSASAANLVITWARGTLTNQTSTPNVALLAATCRGVGSKPTAANNLVHVNSTNSSQLQTTLPAGSTKNLNLTACSARASSGVYPALTETATRLVQETAAGAGSTGISSNNETFQVWSQPGSTSAQTATVTGLSANAYTQVEVSVAIPGT